MPPANGSFPPGDTDREKPTQDRSGTHNSCPSRPPRDQTLASTRKPPANCLLSPLLAPLHEVMPLPRAETGELSQVPKAAPGWPCLQNCGRPENAHVSTPLRMLADPRLKGPLGNTGRKGLCRVGTNVTVVADHLGVTRVNCPHSPSLYPLSPPVLEKPPRK